jgi:hypothetical protein
MATSQEKIKIELTRLAIKFKDISLKGAKPADYKEIENAFRRLNQIYPFYVDLNELTDVTISAPAPGEVLAYNGVTGQWENTVPGSGSGLGDMTKAVYDSDNDGSVDKAETVQIIVRNATGITLTKGQIVYLSGATGNRPNAVLAQANSEVSSSKTIGAVVANIANNSDGYVAVIGTLHDLDTSMFAAGDRLWLSPTTPGGMTTTVPSEPNHAVFIGTVARAHPTQGRIVYAIQNGYELNELHDVVVPSPSDGDLLRYDSANSYWENWTPNFLTPGSDTYIHIQSAPSSVWSIAHPLLKFPSVTVVDSANNKVEGDINYVDTNNLTVTFSGSFAGKAYLN